MRLPASGRTCSSIPRRSASGRRALQRGRAGGDRRPAPTEERTAFMVEVKQAGLFRIGGFEEEAHAQARRRRTCPAMLFPFAREAVADLVRRRRPAAELVPQPVWLRTRSTPSTASGSRRARRRRRRPADADGRSRRGASHHASSAAARGAPRWRRR
ncbi:MAG: protein-export chaperone SecB [Halofilum sp. (in: g-proteobacteria)]|nr:protein-export chaperone SecB [Halofilum sp. (in: g-proteobacteria)]